MLGSPCWVSYGGLYYYIGSHTILNQIRSEYNSIRKKIKSLVISIYLHILPYALTDILGRCPVEHVHVNIIFFNLQNVSFLCNCGGLAIIVTKIAQMLQFGLRCYNMVLPIPCKHGIIYTMRTFGCIRIPDPNLRMSNLA